VLLARCRCNIISDVLGVDLEAAEDISGLGRRAVPKACRWRFALSIT